MSLLEVTVSILLMAAGVTACSEAWTSSLSQIAFASDLNAASLCADNTSETLIASDSSLLVQAPVKTVEENIKNDSSCKVQILPDTVQGEKWEEIVARSGKAIVKRWIVWSS